MSLIELSWTTNKNGGAKKSANKKRSHPPPVYLGWMQELRSGSSHYRRSIPCDGNDDDDDSSLSLKSFCFWDSHYLFRAFIFSATGFSLHLTSPSEVLILYYLPAKLEINIWGFVMIITTGRKQKKLLRWRTYIHFNQFVIFIQCGARLEIQIHQEGSIVHHDPLRRHESLTW